MRSFTTSTFAALIHRMANIERWSLMKNASKENLKEHSFDVAIIVWLLCELKEQNGVKVNKEHLVLKALFHDVPEIITGDLPTPVKNSSSELKAAYKHMEQSARVRIQNTLPEPLRVGFGALFAPDENDELVKAADKLSALIKCLSERKAGNMDFTSAESDILLQLRNSELTEVNQFLEVFYPSYGETLDSLFT